MSDTPLNEGLESVRLPQSFSVRPYRPDGGFSFGGALQLVGFLGLAGIILGAVASFVSRFIYLILIFPILIGVAVGFVGGWCIKAFKIRRPRTCGVAGFVAGCLAMLSMHYFDYDHFQSEVQQEFGADFVAMQGIARNLDAAKAGLDQLPEEERAGLQEFIAALEEDDEFRLLLQVDSFPSFMQFQAVQGVEITSARGGGKGLNLGYWGTWIYWSVEALIVAGFAFLMMKGEAANPFCAECSAWKTAQTWGPFSQGELVRQMLDEGRIEPLRLDPTAAGMNVLVTAYRCPHCPDEGDMDVRLERLTINSKGEAQKMDLTRVTFPAEAYPALVAACTTPPEVPA